MASDPGCLRFSLLFRIRLSLPSCFSCRPAFPFPPRFPACTRLFLHPLQLCVFVIRPVRPIAVFPTAVGLTLFPVGLLPVWPVAVRPVRPIAVFPTAVGLTLFPVGLIFVRPVVRPACCRSARRPFHRPLCRPATVQESPDFPRARPATCLTAVLAEFGRRPPVSSRFLRRRP